MAIMTFKRYEKKFLLSSSQYNAIYPVLMKYLLPDENCKNGQGYSIYNIYFDTVNSSLIRHSLSGPYYKEKLRLRSYNIPKSSNSTVFLELKKKTGGIVNKRRAVLTLEDAYNFLNYGIRPCNADYLNTQVLNEIAFFLKSHDIKPAVYISCFRTAYFGKDDPSFRVTFDNRILTRREDLNIEKGCYGDDLLEPGQYLMEVKVARALPPWFARLLSENHIYKTSFSKYGREYTHSLLASQADHTFNIAV